MNTEATTTNNNHNIAQRAYHPDEVERRKDELAIDFEWYLGTQILPPISRLCEPIEGTSAAILSEKLGLDAAKYARSTGATDDFVEDAWGYTPTCLLDDAERFKGVERLVVKCTTCLKESELDSIMDVQQGADMLACKQCHAMYLGRDHPRDAYCYLSNRVNLLVRQCVKKYYDCWLKCDDSSCDLRTMQQSIRGVFCTMDGCSGRLRQEYDENMLHTQLKYLESLFDVKRFQSRKSIDDKTLFAVLPRDHQEVLRLLKEDMASVIKGSAYNWVRPSLWSAVFGKLGASSVPNVKALL
ncbi:hypothetical protein EON65_03720 [archaeon]|nr:MAG: hypothetical protein EON65_03720 [archaeon]